MRMVKIFTLLLVAVAPLSASAQRRNPLAGQPAIRHRVEMRKLRFEVTPQFMVSTNQDYRHSFGPGGNLQFHITDWIGIGLSGSYHFTANTTLEDRIVSQLPDGGYTTGPQPTKQIHNERVLNLNALASVYASLTPWAGKFAMFGSAFANYDFFVNLGLGLVNYTQNNCCANIADPPLPTGGGTVADPNLQDASQFAGLKVGGMVGVGVHIYFTQWFGLQLELRDYFVRSNPGGLDTDGDRLLCSGQQGAPRGSSIPCNGHNDETIQNHIFFGVGLTFMLPPKAKISK